MHTLGGLWEFRARVVFGGGGVIFLLFMYNVSSEGIEKNESGIMTCLMADKTDSGAVSV